MAAAAAPAEEAWDFPEDDSAVPLDVDVFEEDGLRKVWL